MTTLTNTERRELRLQTANLMWEQSCAAFDLCQVAYAIGDLAGLRKWKRQHRILCARFRRESLAMK